MSSGASFSTQTIRNQQEQQVFMLPDLIHSSNTKLSYEVKSTKLSAYLLSYAEPIWPYSIQLYTYTCSKYNMMPKMSLKQHNEENHKHVTMKYICILNCQQPAMQSANTAKNTRIILLNTPTIFLARCC